jgi:twitching motility protein PilJ
MKKTVLIALTGFICLITATAAAEDYKIGVLAKDGPIKAMQMWKATADYLTEAVDGKTFEIVPLDFDAVNPAVEKEDVDFLLVNSSMFVTAQVKYRAFPIATMINSRQGKPLSAFGGVIFTQADNDSINSLADLKGKAFMAVAKQSFGGWQMACMEMIDAGVDPDEDFAKLDFGGKHENVVLAVLNGVVDAGTVRTDTLERMEATGIIGMDEFKIINQKKHGDFPFVCSTKLYPEWPLAKVKNVSYETAEQVLHALKQLNPDDKAAQDAKVVGWTDSLDYAPVVDLQRALHVGAFAW